MKTSWRNLKTLVLALSLVGMALVNSACSKNETSAVVPTNPYGVYNGTLGYGSVSGSTVAIGDWGQNPDIELRLSFGSYGQGIAASGQLIAQSPICGFPPGVYQVQTSQPGYVSGNTVYNLALNANGIPIAIYNATVDSNLRINSYNGGITIGNCPQMYFY